MSDTPSASTGSLHAPLESEEVKRQFELLRTFIAQGAQPFIARSDAGFLVAYIHALAADRTRLQQENEELTKDLKLNAQMLARQCDLARAAENERDSAVKQFQAAERDCQTLQASLTRLQTERDEAFKERNTFEIMLPPLHRRIAELKAEVTRLQTQIAQLEAERNKQSPHKPPSVHHLCGPNTIGVTGPPHASWCHHIRTWVDGAAQQDDYECGACGTKISTNISEWREPDEPVAVLPAEREAPPQPKKHEDDQARVDSPDG